MLQLIAQATDDPASIIGSIEKPPGVAAFDNATGAGADGIGLLIFISNLIRIGTIIAGIWVMFNIVLAGWMYISGSGDSGQHAKVRDSITNSVLGLIVIVSAYTIAGLIGLLFFGDAAYFLNPTIPTPAG
jgi:hypothetical protein